MSDVPYIVSQLNASPFNMKLLGHKFSDLKGLDLLQTVRNCCLPEISGIGCTTGCNAAWKPLSNKAPHAC